VLAADGVGEGGEQRVGHGADGTVAPVRERIFTLEATPVKYGPGAAADAGWELARLGVRRALLVTDPGVAAAGHPDRVRAAIEAAGIEVVVFDGARVEPTLDSLQQAADFARDAGVDGFVSVGGGSAMDTAKVADLIVSHPAPVMEYVNPPVGAGRKPPSPLKPHLAIPTTSGTGSEATTVAVLDLPELHVKSGISHRYLRPHQAIVDPELAVTAPAEVVASAGLDVVCHAAESYLSRPYDQRDRPATPDDRPPYQGANPVADVWSAKALEYGGRFLRRAVAGAADTEARGAMMLAATMAGVGFGSAGVHIPHACAYPIAGLRPAFRPPGYPDDHPFVPHGLSVIVTAPAAFRFTYEAAPERHDHVAALLGASETGPDALPGALLALMRAVGAPRGIEALGYGEADIPELVAGARKQQRLLVVAPRAPADEDLAAILRASLVNW
jgi:alcohol dehydrogenase class IV